MSGLVNGECDKKFINFNINIDEAYRLHTKCIYKMNDFFKLNMKSLLSDCTFNGSRRNAWVKLHDLYKYETISNDANHNKN